MPIPRSWRMSSHSSMRYYPCAWARYDLAVPGSLKLLPATASHLKDLAEDYDAIQIMLFGTPPEFGGILDALKKLEADINESTRRDSL